MITAILTDQALQSIVLLAFVATLGDLATGVLAAFRSGRFKWNEVGEFIASHLLARVFPVVFVAALASTLAAAVAAMADPPVVLTGAIAATWAAAWAAVLAYVLETLASLKSNLRTAAGKMTPRPPAWTSHDEHVAAPEAAAVAEPEAPEDGAALIAAERERQVTVEEYDAEHDDGRVEHLTDAAIAYALASEGTATHGLTDFFWPWAEAAWKPTPDDHQRERVKAGALLAAAIDAANDRRRHE